MFKSTFFGASTVEGAGASTPRSRFSAIVARSFGWQEINLGMGGTTVAGRDDEGQVTDEDSGLGRVPDVLDTAPDLVFILYGANDFARGIPVGSPAKFRQGTFLSDYDTMLRGLMFVLAPAQIVVSTCVYRADAADRNAAGAVLEDYNHVIRSLGNRYGLLTLDAYVESGIDADTWARLSADEAHLNDAGHERLAGFFIHALQTARGAGQLPTLQKT